MITHSPADYIAEARQVIESADRFHMNDAPDDAQHRRETALVYALIGIGEELQNMRLNGLHISTETI